MALNLRFGGRSMVLSYSPGAFVGPTQIVTLPSQSGLRGARLTTALPFNQQLNYRDGSLTLQLAGGAPITLDASINAIASVTGILTTAIRLASSISGTANVTGNLNTAIRLNSAVTATANTTGALTTAIQLASAASATATAAADLTVSAGLAANLTATANTTAALTTAINLASSVSATVVTTANLTTAIRLNSALATSAAVTGGLNTAIRLASAVSATAATTANLNTAIRLASAISATANTTGALTTAIRLASAVSATATVSGELTTGAADFVGSLTATANTTAALNTAIRLAAALSATANATSNLTTAILMAGNLNALVTVAPALTTAIRLQSAIATSAVTNAGLTTAIRLAATPSATATVAGALTTAIRMAGALVATATATPSLTTQIPLLGSLSATANATSSLTTAIQLAANPTASTNAAANLTTAIRLGADVLAQVVAEADLTTRPAILLEANATVTATLEGILGFARRPDEPQKPLIKALELMPPDQTNILGIHQSDIIIRTAIIAGLADMRAKPWLLNYVFSSLPKDPLTWKEYGEKHIQAAKDWFLTTHVPVRLVPVLTELEIPSITITLLESSEVLPEATVGDVHYEPAEDANSFPPTLTSTFEPKSFNSKTGIIELEELPDIVFISPGMYIVDSVGRYHQIIEVIDDLTFKIKPGTIADFSQSVLKSSRNARIGLESSSFKETYRIGIHVGGDPEKLSWLHSFVVFCLMRYKEPLLEGRGFERSTIQSSDFGRDNGMETELVFSRNITITGFVRQYWPKSLAQPIDTVQLDAMAVSGVVTPGVPTTGSTPGPDVTVTSAGLDPNEQLWVGNLDLDMLSANRRK